MYDPTQKTGWLLDSLIKAGPTGPIETPYGTVYQDSEAELAAKFPAGKHVRYVPYHAEGDANHEDCENGIVSSVRSTTIFVRFGLGVMAQGCKADQLV